MKSLKKHFCILLSLIILIGSLSVGIYADGENDDTGRTQPDSVFGTADEEIPPPNGGTRTVDHFYFATFDNGDMMTCTGLDAAPYLTRYSSGNSNSHYYQKWELSSGAGGIYAIFPLGGDHPYALSVNPSTKAVTAAFYDSSDNNQKWYMHYYSDGSFAISVHAGGTSAAGNYLYYNGTSFVVSSTQMTTFIAGIDYDEWVPSTEVNCSNFYVAPQSTRYAVRPTDQTGNRIAIGQVALYGYNNRISVKGIYVTGESAGTSSLTVKDKISGISVTKTVTVTKITEGTYYLRNRETSKYARVYNGTMSDGQSAVYTDFDGTNYEKWILKLDNLTGYYSIKSKASPVGTPFYLCVSGNSSALNTAVVINNSSTLSDGMKWRFVSTSDGAYKIVPKTGEANGYALAANTSTGGLVQGVCTNDSYYYDEWLFLLDNNYSYGLTISNNYPESCCVHNGEDDLPGNYNSFGDYADNVKSGLLRAMSFSFDYRGSNSRATDLKNKYAPSSNHDYLNMDDVDFMIFVGHGYAKNRTVSGSTFSNNSLHFSSSTNASNHSYGNENDNSINFSTNDALYFGYKTKTKWLLTYTCNFLNTAQGDSNVYHLLDRGGRLILGYGSKCYIVPNEGSDFAAYLENGYSFRYAFFNAGIDNLDFGPFNLFNDSPAWLYRIAYIGTTDSGSLDDTLYNQLEQISDRTTKIKDCEVNKYYFNDFLLS